MPLLSKLVRHLLFTLTADIVRNPEKYSYHAKRAYSSAVCKARNAKEKIRNEMERIKKSRQKQARPSDTKSSSLGDSE